MAAVYKFWTAIVFLAVLVQVGFAGYGAFYVGHKIDDAKSVTEKQFEDGFGPHAGFGYLVVLAILLLLVIAAVARVGKPRLVRCAILAGLGILQVILAWVGFGVPGVGALHPINALAIFALSGMLAHGAWRGAIGVDGAPARL